MREGCVFNIQRYTVHDGPGIRTEVFLKGCPLSCPWCSNPESQACGIEPGIYPSRCLGREVCGMCERHAGSSGIVDFDEAGKLRSVCRSADIDWGEMAGICPSGAIRTWGKRFDVEGVLQVVERDRRFFEASGGVTVSGGEPLMQAEFTREILASCRRAGIHTCLESTLLAPWDALEPAIDEADSLIVDLKCVDEEKHALFTGSGNSVIIENLLRASGKVDEVLVRIPVIPGFNDAPEDLDDFESFFSGASQGCLRRVQLLEFMRLGEDKYRSLERAYPMDGEDIDRVKLHRDALALRDRLLGCGVECCIDGHPES